MALPRNYATESCPIARTLEVIGERWTMLIIRDAFYGVRRFSDFRDHLSIPRAVLTDRLNLLVKHEVLARTTGNSGREEYDLTSKGEQLWPAVWTFINWGNEHYVPPQGRRPITHVNCGGVIRADGTCEHCGAHPATRDLVVHPQRHRAYRTTKTDETSTALSQPHRMLTPTR